MAQFNYWMDLIDLINYNSDYNLLKILYINYIMAKFRMDLIEII